MPQELVELIGATEGAEMPFDQWRTAAQAAGLNPSKIQDLKRRGLVWTYLNDEGAHFIVRGTKPA